MNLRTHPVSERRLDIGLDTFSEFITTLHPDSSTLDTGLCGLEVLKLAGCGGNGGKETRALLPNPGDRALQENPSGDWGYQSGFQQERFSIFKLGSLDDLMKRIKKNKKTKEVWYLRDPHQEHY